MLWRWQAGARASSCSLLPAWYCCCRFRYRAPGRRRVCADRRGMWSLGVPRGRSSRRPTCPIPPRPRGGRLVRTLRCPGAVNVRIVTSGGLALGGGGSGAGGLLTAAGLAAIALLVADPRAAVLVRERPVVVLARLLLLLPAILLIVLGRAASMMARCLAHPEEVKASETP